MKIVLKQIEENENPQYSPSEEEVALLTHNITRLCEHMKIFGPVLENSSHRGTLRFDALNSL